MQAAYQRSRFDEKEHGFWLTKDGTTSEIVGNAYDIDLGVAPARRSVSLRLSKRGILPQLKAFLFILVNANRK
jgi:hypothetical protein